MRWWYLFLLVVPACLTSALLSSFRRIQRGFKIGIRRKSGIRKQVMQKAQEILKRIPEPYKSYYVFYFPESPGWRPGAEDNPKNVKYIELNIPGLDKLERIDDQQAIRAFQDMKDNFAPKFSDLVVEALNKQNMSKQNKGIDYGRFIAVMTFYDSEVSRIYHFADKYVVRMTDKRRESILNAVKEKVKNNDFSCYKPLVYYWKGEDMSYGDVSKNVADFEDGLDEKDQKKYYFPLLPDGVRKSSVRNRNEVITNDQIIAVVSSHSNPQERNMLYKKGNELKTEVIPGPENLSSQVALYVQYLESKKDAWVAAPHDG